MKTVESVVKASVLKKMSVFLCGHDLLSFVRNFSVRFSTRKLGRETAKI